jgi:hypothetical protein
MGLGRQRTSGKIGHILRDVETTAVSVVCSGSVRPGPDWVHASGEANGISKEQSPAESSLDLPITFYHRIFPYFFSFSGGRGWYWVLNS